MIRDIVISLSDPDDDVCYEPPSRTLTVSVIDDDASLLVSRRYRDNGGPLRGDEPLRPECVIDVPVRSLLLALRAGWDDARGAGAWCDVAEPAPAVPAQEPEPAEVPTQRRDRPPQAGRRWSEQDNAALRGTWLGADETTDADELLETIAAGMERTRNGVRSRLAKLGCDPDVPGRELTARSTLVTSEVQAAEAP